MPDRSSNRMNQEMDKRTAAEKEEDKQQSEKANEYVRELMQEKLELDPQKAPNSARLLDQGMLILLYLLLFVPIVKRLS